MCHVFSAMLIHGVVPSLFGLGIILPLIKGHNLDSSASENYRGITLSAHISKIFEMCILEIYSNYLWPLICSLALKRVGCSHALYAVKSVVHQFISGNSTVNLCALDMSKMFDKLNHYALFAKLMDRNVPLLFFWISWWTGIACVQQLCSGTICSLLLYSCSVVSDSVGCCPVCCLLCMWMIWF